MTDFELFIMCKCGGGYETYGLEQVEQHGDRKTYTLTHECRHPDQECISCGDGYYINSLGLFAEPGKVQCCMDYICNECGEIETEDIYLVLEPADYELTGVFPLRESIHGICDEDGAIP